MDMDDKKMLLPRALALRFPFLVTFIFFSFFPLSSGRATIHTPNTWLLSPGQNKLRSVARYLAIEIFPFLAPAPCFFGSPRTEPGELADQSVNSTAIGGAIEKITEYRLDIDGPRLRGDHTCTQCSTTSG
jgi:hypothetical protein